MRNAPPERPGPPAPPHRPHSVPALGESGASRGRRDGGTTAGSTSAPCSGAPGPDAGDSTTLAWLENAACRDLDTELFFPIGLNGPGRHQANAAKAVCKACPVRRQCAGWALTTAQEYGIWGGMDEEELALARRRRKRSDTWELSSAGLTPDTGPPPAPEA